LSLLVDASLTADDVATARAYAGQLRDLADAGGPDRVTAMMLTAEGGIAAATGQRKAAESAFSAAVAAWSDEGLSFEAARTRCDLAALVAATRPDEAAELARECLGTFQHLGAESEVDRTLALLRGLGAPARVSRPSRSLLSAREEEVLGLLAQGLSNPEIAQRLYLSPRTVAHHVSSILSKLQVRNRTEAVAFATRSEGGEGSASVPTDSSP
jgi:DNA-binding NarL/FixJ family response regulator